MTHRVELDLNDDLFGRIQAAAEREYRSAVGQIMWVLDNRFRSSPDPESAQAIQEAAVALRSALQGLHREAGKPSTRALAAVADVSHTTVADVLSGQRVPPWPTLEKVVKALGGSPGEFRDMWSAAQQ